MRLGLDRFGIFFISLEVYFFIYIFRGYVFVFRFFVDAVNFGRFYAVVVEG